MSKLVWKNIDLVHFHPENCEIRNFIPLIFQDGNNGATPILIETATVPGTEAGEVRNADKSIDRYQLIKLIEAIDTTFIIFFKLF